MLGEWHILSSPSNIKSNGNNHHPTVEIPENRCIIHTLSFLPFPLAVPHALWQRYVHTAAGKDCLKFFSRELTRLADWLSLNLSIEKSSYNKHKCDSFLWNNYYLMLNVIWVYVDLTRVASLLKIFFFFLDNCKHVFTLNGDFTSRRDGKIKLHLAQSSMV